MSKKITAVQSIIKQLRWTNEETIAAILVIIVLSVFMLTISQLEPGIRAIDELISERTGNGLSFAADWLKEFDTIMEGLVALLWASFGAFVYMIFWIIRTTLSRSSGTYHSLKDYIHPHGYSVYKAFINVFLRKFEFIVVAGIIVLYGLFWSEKLLQPITDAIATNNSFEWADLYVLLRVLLLVVSMHVFAFLFRILAGKHHQRFVEYG